MKKEFLTAGEMAERSAMNWPEKTMEEIMEKACLESSRGNRNATFYNSRISQKTAKELKKLGYKCHIFEVGDTPAFRIFW